MFILGQLLTIRLREDMREDKGGAYGVGGRGQIARSPHQERDFTIQFGCDPKRVDELVKGVYDQIAATEKDPDKWGERSDYLDKVKEQFRRQRETDLRTNSFWAGWLVNAFHYGDDPTLVLDIDAMIKRVTADNVKAAAKRYLDNKSVFTAVLLPEK